MSESKTGKILFAGVLGAIAGAVGGLLFAPQSGQKTRADVAKLADKIVKQIRLGAEETQKRIKDTYGASTQKARDSYEEIKQEISQKVAAVKEAGETVDKERYAKIVDNVIEGYKDDFEATKNGATKLAEMLKKDWEKVKKALI